MLIDYSAARAVFINDMVAGTQQSWSAAQFSD
jgi:hypothetical protein